MRKKVLILGAGGHAAACLDVINESKEYKVGEIVGVEKEVGNYLLGNEIRFTNADLEALSKRFKHAFVAVGQIKSSSIRENLVSRLNEFGFRLPTFISSSAHVSAHVKIGVGTIFMNGSIVNSQAEIGNHCIVNSNALLEHGVKLGDFVHISTGVLMNGDSSVGSGSFIGSGTIVRENIHISENVTIGMGSIILRDVPAGSVIKGKY